MRYIFLLSLLILSACSVVPKISDPTISFPTPPPVLMEPPAEQKTITVPK